MRNPAPIVLTLLLAVAALVVMITRPETEPGEPKESPKETPSSEAAAGTGQPSLSDPQSVAWPHDESDLPTDPKAVFGNLENGMRYIILPNGEPPERVSIRLHIKAGSLMERKDQRGLAHFLEHMVFNGSKNFTPEELIPRMQRLGIAFGAHVNAYTSFDETVYMLDLPDLSDEMLGLGFTVMRDFADGALLKTDEIDKERGVILAEKTSRDSVDYRLMLKQFETLMPDSLLTKRFPIGVEEVIRNAPRERFVEFYESYYAPERMTFVVVGDIDPGDAKRRIEEAFGSLTNPESPGTDPKLGEIREAEGVEAFVFADKEVSATELGLLTIEGYTPLPDLRKTRVERLRLALAHSMLGTRFDRLAKKEGSPILGGSSSRSDLFNYVTLGSIDVAVADDRWPDATAVLEQEFRRALEHGFTAAEFAEARANTLNRYEQAVESKDSRQSGDLATGITRSINDGRVLTDPATDLEVVATALDELTAADCHAAFRGFWADKGVYLILTTKEEPDGAREALLDAYRAAAEVPVEAPEEAEVKTFAYTDFGDAGEIASQEEIEGLGITRLVLGNGVTVNFKQTDFEKNRIQLKARIGYGRLTAPTDKPGLADFATAVVNEAGVGVHSADELQQIFAGRNVSAGFSVQEDHFSISGGTTPDDLEAQLQLMTARLLHPAYRDEAIEQFRKAVPMLFQQLKHTPSGPMQEMSSWLRGGDPRFSFPGEPEVFLAYEASDLEPWLGDAFTPASVELNVVGDFDPDSLIPAILATFGAIEQRPDRWQAPALDRSVEFPEAPQTKTFTFESKIPQCQAAIVWKCPGPREDRRRFRRLQILADILGDRLREEIREELGASYSPQAGASGSTALEDFGFLMALSRGTPENIPQLTAVSVNLADQLATGGATEDELDRARNPALADIEKSLRDNSYWLGNVMSGSTIEAEMFELARDRKEDIASITLEEINQLATDYFGKDRAIQVLIRPDAPEDAGDDEKEEED
jgi:zinc protease